MILWIKKAWSWIRLNSKYILLILASILLLVLALSWYRKNTKIRKLEAELAVLRAKVKLERLAGKQEVLLEDLNKLRKDDLALELEIKNIENNLETKLAKDLTAKEIAEKFKKLGV